MHKQTQGSGSMNVTLTATIDHGGEIQMDVGEQ